MLGINALRRQAIAAEVERLTGVPTTWALAVNPLINPVIQAHIYLRNAGRRDRGSPNRLRKTGTSKLETTMGQEATASIEVRIVSLDPNMEAQEIAARLNIRFWRGTTAPRWNPLGMAFQGLDEAKELPTETESDVATSVCLQTMLVRLADTDTVIDDFDGWIETTGPVTTTDVAGDVTGGL